METKTEQKMEILFGFFGNLTATILLIIAAFITPGYTPLEDTVSSLGYGIAKSLFSIGFVIAGSLSIPFYIYLQKELININEKVRKFATGASIFTCVCIALVGIIPDETYIDAFLGFHAFVAYISFIGSCLYIGLYSYLMYKGPTATSYEGPIFKRYLAYFGFFIDGCFILLLITQAPLIEWIVTISIIIWILTTAIHLIVFKFFNIPGVYFRKTKYPEALKLFEDALQILNNLNLNDEPIKKTLKENIEFLKGKIEKNE
jgi:hypothetical membrane protein